MKQLKRIILGCSLLAVMYAVGALISRDSVHAQIVNPSTGTGGTVPTGTGWPHITAGAQDAAARAVNLASNGASGDVTGALDKANIGTLASGSNGLAASATTDTTVATNISSGTLPAGRMPALTNDCTTSAGAVALTCTKLNGITYTQPIYLASAMGQQTTATCTDVTGMTWNIAANKQYRLHCELPVTFVASATIAMCLGGPGTATSFTLVDSLPLSTSVVNQFETINQTAYGTKTAASAAPGALSRVVHVDAQISNGATASGTALTLQTAANGTNGITVLADSVCQLTQVN